ncbi:MAG: YtxH domain-containing protein [Candidatus Aminicenantes bacterium]|nr:YtxH domain-containing protein [Candidatus Aminicenantes bacterium]
MSSDNGGSFASTLLGFLTGAALGAGFALLYAPQSGEDTRKQIKEAADKASDEVKDNYKKIEKTALKNYDNAKLSVDKGIEQMKTMVDDLKKSIKTEIKAEVKKETAKKAAK